MLWTDAWIADTKHLSRLERGTYHDLLVLMWRTPGCRVPNDDVWLGKRLGMTQPEVETELRPIISEFCQTDGNHIWQKRLLKEMEWAQEKASRQSVRSKAFWEQQKGRSKRNAGSGSPNGMPPYPTHTKQEERKEDSSPNRNRDEYPSEFLAFYETYPRHEGKGAAHKAWLKITKGGKVSNEELIAGALRYRDDPNRDPAYTKHPATWLNAGCHTDCPLPLRGGANGHGRNGGSILDACDRVEEQLGGKETQYVAGSTSPQPRNLDHKVRPPSLRLLPKG